MAEYAEKYASVTTLLRVFRHFRVFRVLPVVLKEPHPQAKHNAPVGVTLSSVWE